MATAQPTAALMGQMLDAAALIPGRDFLVSTDPRTFEPFAVHEAKSALLRALTARQKKGRMERVDITERGSELWVTVVVP